MVTFLPKRILSNKQKKFMSNKYSRNIRLVITLLIIMTVIIASCKDNMINNVYLNLTQNLRIEDTNELNNDGNVLKIHIKDFDTGENISGAEAVLHFSNGYRISVYSGIKGLVEADKKIIPHEDFDVSVCYSKNGSQYFIKQRIFYNSGMDRITVLYLIPGNCDLI